MTKVIELGDGKQIVVNEDGGVLRLTVCACRGALGVQMSKKDAVALRRALFEALYPSCPASASA